MLSEDIYTAAIGRTEIGAPGPTWVGHRSVSTVVCGSNVFLLAFGSARSIAVDAHPARNNESEHDTI